MKKKFLALCLAVCMLIAMLPAMPLPVAMAGDIADMDALSALGIDTSTPPQGFNEHSKDNPYGRDVIEVSPVYELYTLGLSDIPKYDESRTDIPVSETPVNATAHYDKDRETETSLTSTLYGHEAWGAKTTSEIINSGVSKSLQDGKVTKTGKYAAITDSEFNDGGIKYKQKGYLAGAEKVAVEFDDFDYALSAVTSGNFDGNKNGLSEQTAMVYTKKYGANGGIYLRFGDVKNGYGDNSIELLPDTSDIGNPQLMSEDRPDLPVENFVENPYQLQNYLQVATGDWNGDGIDDVAVYIPEPGKSRIVVYTLQLRSSDIGNDGTNNAYSNAGSWRVAWTYNFNEGGVVSNMVSLESGDVNQDGIDDLAATWGYYYGPTQNAGSKAVVMFGGKDTSMLQKNQAFSLSFGNSNIVRGAFTFGDIIGSGQKTLILCGQSDTDLQAGKLYTRYVALYSWNGNEFTSAVNKNFDLFEKEDGKYVHKAMAIPGGDSLRTSGDEDRFYSLPLCVSNAAVMTKGIADEGGDRLYFDSLIISLKDNDLVISEAWDVTSAMQESGKISDFDDYVEYSAVAGDLTGQTGAAAVITMQQTLSKVEKDDVEYTVSTSQSVPVYEWKFYYKNWLNKLFGIKTWYSEHTGYRTETGSNPVLVEYEKFTEGKAFMVAADASTGYNSRTQTDFATSLCLMNTDNDSSYMNYTGTHYYTYSDPEVLAVIASPPYFADLLNRDDLSGNYAESSTSYASSSGGSSGFTTSATIKAGAYVAFEQDVKVFGVTVASFEAENAITAGFTWETEKTSTLDQTITYTAASGEDMLAFYSIPLEIYEFETYVPDGTGGYEKVATTVHIPHEATVKLLSLDDYEAIAKDYSALPTIADNVLTHTVGDPSSYPSSTNGYNIIAAYNGDPSAVGYSSTDGGSSISQEIAMSEEKSNAYSATLDIETKVGAGVGGAKVGVIAGAGAGCGTVKVSTTGSSFSGDMQNMPIEAKPYNYAMNWKIFCYKYTNAGKSFPVVNYIVSDISAPPILPDDFEQNVGETKADSITLTWSYDKLVSGFQLYRYYEFPDGTGSYELEFVPFTAASGPVNGRYYFKYTDKNLSPYTNYTYQIQTVSAARPGTSIYSEPMNCRTKTEVGYPDITINGLVGEVLPLYPDALGTAAADVKEEESYNGLSYQWQKLIGNTWTDIPGQATKTLTISNAGTADVALYRCRVNAIYYDETAAQEYHISAYSGSFATAYSKRTPMSDNKNDFNAKITADKLNASIRLFSANTGHSAAPTGTVIFTVTGTDYNSSKTVALAASNSTADLGGQERYFSEAKMDLSGLKTGVYKVSAYYSGSRVFKDLYTVTKIVIVGEGSAFDLNLDTDDGDSVTSFTYGDNINPELSNITKGSNGIAEKNTISSGVTYVLKGTDPDTGAPTTQDFPLSSGMPPVGSYTLEAYYKAPSMLEKELVAQQNFVVTRRNATVTAADRINVASADVSATPVLMNAENLAVGDTLEDIKLTYKATNSAGNEIPLLNSTDPGNYKVMPCAGEDTDMDIYQNYNFTFVAGTYTIIGATYGLNIRAAAYTDTSGTRNVGIAGISDVSGDTAQYVSGTSVMLYATPNIGYEVDTWTATFADSSAKSQVGGTRFLLTTQAQAVSVVATFKPTSLTLSTVCSPVQGGTLTCSDPFFNSGAIVTAGTELTFTAIPAEGYHFKEWLVGSSSANSYPAGKPNADGSNTLAVEVGAISLTVYAYFERDTYALTLKGDIQAHYDSKDDVGNAVNVEILSGTAVHGDTLITVSPKPGYSPADSAVYMVNGTEYTPDENGVIIFTITQDTIVSLNSVQNDYAITTSAENGAVTAKIDGADVQDSAYIDVGGGAKAVFTAKAERGYVFDHWLVNSEISTESSNTLIIGAVGANQDVVAVFAANTEYTASAIAMPALRGKISYTLYDIYGELVGDEQTEMPIGGIAVYKGESIKFNVTLAGGSMIEQWTGIDASGPINSKEYMVRDISKDINIAVILKASSNYRVFYEAADAIGNNLYATADAVPFGSNTLLGGGSELVFTAEPGAGKMVSHWTIATGDTTTTEKTTIMADGVQFVDPIYKLDHLMGNITVRAHFTSLVEHTVSLPQTETMGVTEIIYRTPIEAADNGETSATSSEDVRSGGTLVMTFKANSGFGTDISTITAAIENAGNDDQVVSVTENDGMFTATVKNITDDISLAEEDLYYPLYTITVPGNVTSSHSEAKEGEEIALTITPEYGYELGELTLSEGTLKEDVSPDTLVYTFNMPAQAVSVEAEFTEIIVEPTPSPSPTPTPNPPSGFSGGGGGSIKPTKYAITVQSGEGGSISPTSAEVEKGAKVTFTITANEGYEISDVLVDSASIGAVSTYTFENILTAHSISASFAKKEDIDDKEDKELRPYKGFSDVNIGDWFYNAVVFVYENSLMNGTSEDAFEPQTNLTRAMFVTILYRMSGEEYIGRSGFADVPAEEWYSEAIAWAAESGIVSGYSDTEFAPNASITREQLAQMFYSFAQYMEYDTAVSGNLDAFIDADKVSPWAADAIVWAVASGLIEGSYDEIRPDGEATRAESAAILMRFMQLYR